MDALFDIIQKISAAIAKFACSTQRSMSDCQGSVMRFQISTSNDWLRMPEKCWLPKRRRSCWIEQIKWSETMSECMCMGAYVWWYQTKTRNPNDSFGWTAIHSHVSPPHILESDSYAALWARVTQGKCVIHVILFTHSRIRQWRNEPVFLHSFLLRPHWFVRFCFDSSFKLLHRASYTR